MTGYAFFSSSDTEVILKAYDHWGERCVRAAARDVRLRDLRARSGRWYWCADRLGIKPLYLARGRALRCASPRRSRRCWPAAGSTPRSTRWRCTTTSAGTPSCPRRGRSSRASGSSPPATVMTVEPDGEPHERALLASGLPALPRVREWTARTGPAAVLEALRAPPSSDGWWPTSPSACCCPAGSTPA